MEKLKEGSIIIRTGRMASSVLESSRSGPVLGELALSVVEGDVEIDVEN